MSWLDLFILALATWRLSVLAVYEDWPFDIGKRFRTRYPLGGLLNCLYCFSFWAAVACYVLWTVAPVVNYVLAVSALALLAWRYTGSEHSL